MDREAVRLSLALGSLAPGGEIEHRSGEELRRLDSRSAATIFFPFLRRRRSPSLDRSSPFSPDGLLRCTSRSLFARVDGEQETRTESLTRSDWKSNTQRSQRTRAWVKFAPTFFFDGKGGEGAAQPPSLSTSSLFFFFPSLSLPSVPRRPLSLLFSLPSGEHSVHSKRQKNVSNSHKKPL